MGRRHAENSDVPGETRALPEPPEVRSAGEPRQRDLIALKLSWSTAT